jgi:Ala-tRNA(Pro) deacylase
MPKTPDDLLADLWRDGIAHAVHRHAPVATVAEMLAEVGDMPGVHTKNLFLRDAKKSFFLVSMRHDATADLKAMRALIGARGNLSFASAEALFDKLGVTPGSVSPLAVVNDAGNAVTVCLQDDLLAADAVNVHPLTNTMTVSLHPDGLTTFLRTHGYEPVVFSLPA